MLWLLNSVMFIIAFNFSILDFMYCKPPEPHLLKKRWDTNLIKSYSFLCVFAHSTNEGNQACAAAGNLLFS